MHITLIKPFTFESNISTPPPTTSKFYCNHISTLLFVVYEEPLLPQPSCTAYRTSSAMVRGNYSRHFKFCVPCSLHSMWFHEAKMLSEVELFIPLHAPCRFLFSALFLLSFFFRQFSGMSYCRGNESLKRHDNSLAENQWRNLKHGSEYGQRTKYSLSQTNRVLKTTITKPKQNKNRMFVFYCAKYGQIEQGKEVFCAAD